MRKLWRFPQRLRPQGFPGFENFHTASTASIGDHGAEGTSTAFHTTVRKIVENSVEVVEAFRSGLQEFLQILLRAVYQAELTALVMSRMISVSSGCSFIIFSTRLMEFRTVEW